MVKVGAAAGRLARWAHSSRWLWQLTQLRVKRDFPCPWLALFGECAKGATGKCGPCEREASGVAAKPFPPGAIAQVKTRSAPWLQQLIKE
eukprot:4423071-Pleurochrysis_carterae.AAC.1